MKNNYYAVIMAGGVGSRFWPVSTKSYPKQFHDMLGTGQSLIQRTFERINMLVPTENLFVSTNKLYQELVSSHLPKILKNHILVEPCMRNTAPSILYAALKIYNQNPDAVMLIAPSDHWIVDEFEFLRNIKQSFEYCTTNDVLMTLGIEPDHPNTGYGYIKYTPCAEVIKSVANFTEKPDLAKAESFLRDDRYLWNAGIFVWSAKSILEAFKKNLPEMYKVLESSVYNTKDEQKFIENSYKYCSNISIDFGIMEQACNVKVLPVNFGWSDLGTWGSLYGKFKKDNDANAVIGAKTIFRSSTGNMVRTQNGKHVVIQGLNDYIVVENEDVLLICPRTSEQEIKQIRSQIKEEFGEFLI